MIYQKKTINNVPTKLPLSNSAPVGNPIGTIISTYKKIQPRNYLYCDGSTFDETLYPALYLYLGTNVLPDYRECAMVGAEKNTTDVFDSTETDPSTGLAGTQSHDVYGQGEFKDDQLQDHIHQNTIGGLDNLKLGVYTYGAPTRNIVVNQQNEQPGYNMVASIITAGRHGNTTRGKRKAVYYYIKAVDGVDISDEDTFLNTVKNYVDGKNSYSTDEMLTGGTWIDGKPIYRKVIDVGSQASLNQTIVKSISDMNVDTTISIKAFATQNGDCRTIPLHDDDNSYTSVRFRSVDVRFVSSGLSYLVVGIKAILEYTKTTD